MSKIQVMLDELFATARLQDRETLEMHYAWSLLFIKTSSLDNLYIDFMDEVLKEIKKG